MVNNKIFDHRPIDELFSMVKRDFKNLDSQGLIDNGSLVKVVMHCNERLGLPIREVRERAIEVVDFNAKLPEDFEKLYHVFGLNCTSRMSPEITYPFDNKVDQDVIYKACLTRDQIGCVDNYKVTIERKGVQTSYDNMMWIPMSVHPNSYRFCHLDCPNKRRPGRYEIEIRDDKIIAPFRSGTLYMMYIGMMMDKEGNITYPFHPLITPFYEWSIKERVLTNAIFETDDQSLGGKLKLAQLERQKAWIDAFNFTTEREYGQYLEDQRKEELSWYNRYFKFFQ